MLLLLNVHNVQLTPRQLAQRKTQGSEVVPRGRAIEQDIQIFCLAPFYIWNCTYTRYNPYNKYWRHPRRCSCRQEDSTSLSATMMYLLLALFFIIASSLQLIDGAPVVYDIGNIRPEGIHVLPDGAAETMGLASNGTFALVSEFYYGGIKALDLDTGNITQIVNSTSYGERGTIGLWFDSGVILACSGGAFVGPNNTAAINVFDAVSGELIVECLPEGNGTFLNDVTVINGTAYATDSFQNSIMVMDVEKAKAGECDVSAIETPADIFLSETQWSANGE